MSSVSCTPEQIEQLEIDAWVEGETESDEQFDAGQAALYDNYKYTGENQ